MKVASKAAKKVVPPVTRTARTTPAAASRAMQNAPVRQPAVPAKKVAPAPVKAARPRIERPAFSWDDLPETQTAEYVRGPVRIDVETEIPAVIRAKVLESLKEYVAAPDGQKNATLGWKVQECGSSERAAEFLRLAQRYGKYREERLTVRGAVMAKYPTKVRFCAKPAETRKRNGS